MNEHFLTRAIDLAIEHSKSGINGPFGAVVVKDSKVIGEGWNRVVETHDPSAHAEVVAIRAACKNLGTHILNECTLYASCEPCPMCMSAIYWARIDKLVFAATKEMAAEAGFDDMWIMDELRKSYPSRKMQILNSSPKEGLRAFDSWRDNENKIMY